jgi:hypothetical protein
VGAKLGEVELFGPFFFTCRAFPNHLICKKNVLLNFFSLFSISSIFNFILESLVYPLPIFKVAEKSGRGKIRGLYRRRKDTELPSRLGTTCLKLSRTYLCVMMCSNPITDFFNFEEDPLIKKITIN